MEGYVAHDHSAKLIAARRLPQPLVIRVPFFDEDQDGPKRDGTGKEYTLTIKFIQDLETRSLIRCANSCHSRYFTDSPLVTLLASPTSAGMTFSLLSQP
jgi:hypothetical protein